MKKIIYDKIAYVVALLVLAAFSWITTLGNRVNALEKNDATNMVIHQAIIDKLDRVEKKQDETLIILLKK